MKVFSHECKPTSRRPSAAALGTYQWVTSLDPRFQSMIESLIDSCFHQVVATTALALLDAAETLFLADGFEAVSVRAICSAADANPAAVHYHFGSKDALTTALLEARLAPLLADELTAINPDHADVAQVVGAVVARLAHIHADPVGHLHLQLLARFVATHPDAAWSRPWFRLDDWSTILVALVPNLDHDQARRRWGLAFTLLLSRFGGSHPLPPVAVDALADFITAGLAVPIEETHEPS